MAKRTYITTMLHPVVVAKNPEDCDVVALYRNKALAHKRINEKYLKKYEEHVVFVGSAIPLIEETPKNVQLEKPSSAKDAGVYLARNQGEFSSLVHNLGAQGFTIVSVMPDDGTFIIVAQRR